MWTNEFAPFFRPTSVCPAIAFTERPSWCILMKLCHVHALDLCEGVDAIEPKWFRANRPTPMPINSILSLDNQINSKTSSKLPICWLIKRTFMIKIAEDRTGVTMQPIEIRITMIKCSLRLPHLLNKVQLDLHGYNAHGSKRPTSPHQHEINYDEQNHFFAIIAPSSGGQ